MVAENGHDSKGCDKAATHYAESRLGDESVFVPLCADHADRLGSTLDVVRAITEARGPR